jgi:hypothetical protein
LLEEVALSARQIADQLSHAKVCIAQDNYPGRRLKQRAPGRHSTELLGERSARGHHRVRANRPHPAAYDGSTAIVELPDSAAVVEKYCDTAELSGQEARRAGWRGPHRVGSLIPGGGKPRSGSNDAGSHGKVRRTSVVVARDPPKTLGTAGGADVSRPGRIGARGF